MLTYYNAFHSRVSAVVLAGSVDLSQYTDGQQVFNLNSNDFQTHPGFDINGIKNDVALLHLPQQLDYTENVQPAKLLVDDNQTYLGLTMTSSGFGKTSDQSAPSQQLMFTNLRVVSNLFCSLYFGPIEKSKICCDTRDHHSTCEGDSGGPLILAGTSNIVGLTSFGGQSCEGGTPVVFTRVSAYKDFIEQHVGPLVVLN